MNIYSDSYLQELVEELIKLNDECEWIEFKENWTDENDIGEYISALSNSAALNGKTHGYLLWGIDDETKNIIGTTFTPKETKIGNEELENWILRRLNPRLNFKFFNVMVQEKKLVLLEIPAAYRNPVSFTHNEFIRIGSYKKKLKEFTDKEKQLWRILDNISFESIAAIKHIEGSKVLELIDYPAYFDLLKLSLPDGHQAILNSLLEEDLITKNDSGKYNITNLGAILFARKLDDFPKLKMKAVRVIRYKGINRIETIKEQIGTKGYACGFEGLVDYVNSLLPSNEVIGQALRKEVPMYPELAVRELLANSIIHQDFFVSGTEPLIEIFDDRMEITNSGEPLIAIDKLLNSPPKSRNEKLSDIMRRFGICERRGSGVDKIVFETEFYQLPAPLFEIIDGFTKSTLFSHKEFDDMDKKDKVRACYLHCCLQYASRKKMTNTSLRNRFGLSENKGAVVTRIIKAAIEEGKIVNDSTSESRRDTSYVPFWSVSERKSQND